jgi:phage I-like protein
MTNTLLSFGQDEPIALGPDGTAPTELRLFRRGVNATAKGSFVFDDAAAMAVMARYAEMGRTWVMADYDHGSLQKAPVDPSKSSRAAGTARLELRSGELWATNIRWTPDAKRAIEAGEWPSISPAFSHDENGRPTWLINFGLTGNPATYHPEELIAANALDAPALLEKLDALLAALTPAAPVGANEPPARLVRLCMGKKMRQTGLGAFMAAIGKTAADLAKALGVDENAVMGFMIEDDDEGSGAMGMKPQMYSVLNVAAGADEATVKARVQALVDVEAKLLTATSEKTSSAALGVVEAWKTDAARVKDLSASLAKIEAERLTARVDAMLNTAITEKRITKPEVEGDGGLRVKGLQDPEWLSGYLTKREPIAMLTTDFEQPKTKPENGSEEKAIDVGQRKFEDLSGPEQAAMYTEAPKQYTALKADWESRGRPQFASLRAV